MGKELVFNKDITMRMAMLDSVIEAGKELVKEGVRAVTGDCGYLALYQKEVANQLGMLDSDKIEGEVVSSAEELVQEEPKVGAILLESSVYPPYGAAVQEAVNLPVFDFVTMIDYVYSSVVKKRFQGFM